MATAGLTQASRVMPVVRSRLVECGIVTQSFTPSNDNVPPYRPAAVQVAPDTVPLFPVPDMSAVVAPDPSLNPRASTSPVETVLLMVTGTPADVVALPAASRARAVKVYDPFGVPVEFHDNEYGAVVSSGPIGDPFSRNCTPTTPTSSVASAVRLTTPETVVPAVGAVMFTVGATLSTVVNDQV